MPPDSSRSHSHTLEPDAPPSGRAPSGRVGNRLSDTANVMVEPGSGVLHELTVFIITHNERERLPRCLDSCGFAGRIVVLDSGSTDGTVDYARNRGCHVETHEQWAGFGAQKNRALDLCQTEWVLNIDADEWISPALADEIADVIRSGASAMAWEVSRRVRFEGRVVRGCNWWPHRATRLFRREHGRFNDRLVHESVVVKGDTARLREELDHEPYRDLHHFIRKNLVYARAGAAQMVRDNRTVTALRVLMVGPLRWLRDMFVKGGWRYGVLGIIISSVQAFAAFARYAMVWLDRRRVRQGQPSSLQLDDAPPARAIDE